MEPIYFTPGPSQLYPTVRGHIEAALDAHIPSISHRSQQFIGIYRQTEEGLRELLGIPDDYQVFFLSSANEAWERIIENSVNKTSFHYVNGDFSRKFFDFAENLGRNAVLAEAGNGEGFSEASRYMHLIPHSAELIALCANETSTGVATEADFVLSHKKAHPQKLISVDLVSAWPYYHLDLSQVDFAYFSVQKGFGMPAGLGVLIVSPQAMDKGSYGTYHSFKSLKSKAVKFQTPETPNVLGIYLLGKVVKDFLDYGIQRIRKETEEKAALLYETLSNHPALTVSVYEPEWRSQTVIVADCVDSAPMLAQLAEQGLIVGAGYGDRKRTQLRIANFPAHSPEAMARLIAALNELH